MHKVTFTGFGDTVTVYAKEGDVLLNVINKEGVPVPSDCTDGECGSCIVAVKSAGENPVTHHMEGKEVDKLVAMGALTKDQVEEMDDKDLDPGVRLACQCLVRGDIEVSPYKK